MDPIMKAIKRVYSVTGSPTSVEPEDLKKQRASMERLGKLVSLPAFIKTTEFDIDGIKAEWITPEINRARGKVIMYCHGGGYTCGNSNYARILGSKLAFDSGIEVVSFEYRLAPEYPYPAAIDDALKVWDYLMFKGYGAKEVFVCGDSAGGNLALELLIHLNEEGRMLPKGLVLFSPWTDMTCTGESYETRKAVDPMITKEYVEAVRGAYFGEEKIDPTDIHVSPLFANFEGFPPTLIQVGDNEILLSDSTSLSKRMNEDGVLCRLEVYDDGWHVFQQMPIPRATRAIRQVADFIWEIS